MLGYASPSNTPNNFSSSPVKYGRLNSPKLFRTARAADSISAEYSRLMRSLPERAVQRAIAHHQLPPILRPCSI